MMKSEFEKRIGLVITSEEYNEIEKAYMGLPEKVDKDKFINIWLREDGIQDLFNKRAFTIQSLKEEVKCLNECEMDWVKTFNKKADDYNVLLDKYKAFEEKIITINTLTAV